MIRVLLVRHGETPWNAQGLMQGRTDIALSERGRQQARGAAGLIRGQQPSQAHVSTLVRTHQTLEEFGLGIEPTVWDGLAEVGFGIWEGAVGAELIRDHPEEFAQLRTGGFTPEGGESAQLVTERMRRAFFDIVRATAEAEPTASADLSYAVRTTVLVSHGSALRLLLISLGLATEESWTPLTNAATTIIEVPLQEGTVSSTLPKAGLGDSLESASETELIAGLSDERIQSQVRLRAINLSPELLHSR